MKKLLLLVFAISLITIYSCSEESPLNPPENYTILEKAGLVDSVYTAINGFTSLSKTMNGSNFDYTGLSTIKVEFKYSKSGSDSTPVQFFYLDNLNPVTFYTFRDSINTPHEVTINQTIPSPGKNTTIGYTLKALKSIGDTLGYVYLRDLSVKKK